MPQSRGQQASALARPDWAPQGAGDIEINGSTAGTSDLDIDADITSSGTINFSAPRDILIGAKLETTATDADIILTADSEMNGVGGVRIETAGLLDSEDDVTLTGSDLFITGGPFDSVRVDASACVSGSRGLPTGLACP